MKRKVPALAASPKAKSEPVAEAPPDSPEVAPSAEQSPPAASHSLALSIEALPPLARGLILCGVFFVTLLSCLYLFDRLDLNRSESLIMQWHGRSLSVN
jgi:hypothetical protein